MSERRIDREKLRAAIRKLGDEYVFYMLDDAIDLLPRAKLAKLVGQYLDVKRLQPDALGKTNDPKIARQYCPGEGASVRENPSLFPGGDGSFGRGHR